MDLATKFGIGIDLGTTNCCCYYDQGDRLVCLTFSNGDRILPSYVAYNKDGGILVGESAKSLPSTSSNVVVHNTKRIIGKATDCKEVKECIDDFGAAVEDRNGHPVLRIRDDLVVTPGNVATELLKHILDRVRSVTGMTPTDVCVTIPAYFENNQRTATLQAVIDAGVPKDHITITNEPTAAALCYGVDNNANNARILVYDLGGGTFDVSIMTVRDGEFMVDRYEGNPHLGGSDFDSELLKHLEERYRAERGEGFIPDSIPKHIRPRYRNKLLNIVENCKKNLAFDTDFQFVMTLISGAKLREDDDDNTYEMTVFANELDDCIRSYIEETRKTVEMALHKENLTPNDIDRVVLVGGSSRLRLVHSLLEEMFGSEKLRESVNPDECVAKGACLYLRKDRKPRERIAYSLSKTIVDNRLMCVIPKNSVLPAKYSVTTYTACDDQDEVSSHVCQAQQENNDDTMPMNDSVIKLAPYSFTGFRVASAGEVSFLTTFDIEQCGIVYVTVVERETGKVLLDRQMFKYDNMLVVCY